MGLMERQLQALERIENHAYDYIIGIDEVGIGAWAGPVTVAAVVVPKRWLAAERGIVRDSKDFKNKVPKARLAREKILREHIFPNAKYYCVLHMNHEQVDALGIGVARDMLTESAGCAARLRFPAALIVQDGLDTRAVKIDGSLQGIVCLPKADALVGAVGAASILAKVARDNIMNEYAKLYPDFDFANNAGYHNKTHRLALIKNGPCPIHRRSYSPVKNVLAGREQELDKL